MTSLKETWQSKPWQCGILWASNREIRRRRRRKRNWRRRRADSSSWTLAISVFFQCLCLSHCCNEKAALTPTSSQQWAPHTSLQPLHTAVCFLFIPHSLDDTHTHNLIHTTAVLMCILLCFVCDFTTAHATILAASSRWPDQMAHALKIYERRVNHNAYKQNSQLGKRISVGVSTLYVSTLLYYTN